MNPADRTCPSCGALPGAPCLRPKGDAYHKFHAARVRGTERVPQRRRSAKTQETTA